MADSSRALRQVGVTFGIRVACAAALLLPCPAQTTPPPAPPPVQTPAQAIAPAQAQPPRSTVALFRELSSVELDPAQVYEVREATIVRDDIHITLTEGTIGLLRAVDGRVTGAFFDGDGEVLVMPPDPVERAALARFTDAAVLQDRFSTAFLRFYDDRMLADLKPSLRPPTAAGQFVARYNSVVKTLSTSAALRLTMAFTHQGFRPDGAPAPAVAPPAYLYFRGSGERLGTFDLFYDQNSEEEITAGKMNYGASQYDLWLSFPARSSRLRTRGSSARREPFREAAALPAFNIRARINPPSELQAEADVTVEANTSGERTLVFELSRYLKLSSVTLQGQPLEFIQNEAIDGSQLAQRGNDLVAVVLPTPLKQGERLQLQFKYAGDVMSDAGNGLLYVGARGTWYPRRGLPMSRFEFEFRTPKEWTIAATGKRISSTEDAGMVVTRWVSERPIPIAGFNLGRYETVTVQSASGIPVSSFAASGVEADMPVRSSTPVVRRGPRGQVIVQSMAKLPPLPTAQLSQVAQRAADFIDFATPRLGPFPFDSLALTQMPGSDSQGWPGIVFLSSYAYLKPEERASLPNADPSFEVLYDRIVIAHETAHQWFGDLVSWGSYRDQWISEGLSNYLALMLLEKNHPAEFRTTMESYRRELLQQNSEGKQNRAAGPVTLGIRLVSSKYPSGYGVVTYNRGTWLVHMLRHLLRESPSPARSKSNRAAAPADTGDPDKLFFAVLQRIVQRYGGSQISTADLIREFAAALPAGSRYENKPALDWFLDGWVNATDIPELRLQEVRITRAGGKTWASGTLLQKEGSRNLVTPVPLFAQSPAGHLFAGRVFAEGEETDFRVEVPAGTTKLLLDPENTVLRRQ